jgi:hypothetical protein
VVFGLNDEAVRIAVGIRFGLNISVPHTCRCGALVEAPVSIQFIVFCTSPPSRTARQAPVE